MVEFRTFLICNCSSLIKNYIKFDHERLEIKTGKFLNVEKRTLELHIVNTHCKLNDFILQNIIK